jgi:hypothetical protein
MITRVTSLPVLAAAIATIVAAAPLRAQAQTYGDGATSQWFKSLSSAYADNCCDQADCKRAMSDYRDGAWWARSNRTGAWVEITRDRVTGAVSIFTDAVLCEGDPAPGTGKPRIYCFAPPPLGF